MTDRKDKRFDLTIEKCHNEFEQRYFDRADFEAIKEWKSKRMTRRERLISHNCRNKAALKQ